MFCYEIAKNCFLVGFIMNENTRKTIGKRLEQALYLRHTKQKELAQLLGVPDNTISYFVSGARTPNHDQIIEIARLLNISTDYLYGISDAYTPDKDLQFISKYTGLSEKAVNMFHSSIGNGIQYGDDEERIFLLSLRAIINQFLENHDFFDAMEHYYKFLQSLENVQQSYNLFGEEGSFNTYLKLGNTLKEARMERFDAVDCLSNALLDSVSRKFDDLLSAYKSVMYDRLKSKNEGDSDGNN